MKILLDVTPLMRTGLTGIGVYARSLWHALRMMPDLEVHGRWRIARFGKRHLLRAHAQGPAGPRIPLLSDLNLRGFDIYHGTDFRIPRRGLYRRVVTIHDMVVFEDDLVDHRFAQQGIERMRRTLVDCRPDGVIAISEFTRERILHFFPQLERILHVVPLGVDAGRFTRPLPERSVMPAGIGAGPFLLSVGSVEKRKNLAASIQAFEIARERHGELSFVIAGTNGHGADAIDARIAASKHRNAIHRLGFVDDDLLLALYRGARAVLYPSLYEGFGLPVLEAMAAGSPVITSNRGAMAEAAGSAALLVNPEAPEEIAAAILTLLDEDAECVRLRAAGRERAAAHTWQRCAERTVAAYRAVLP
ncbi:MAG TPA: glycosyltransferase family 1 protein [Candidatus Kapabacteria bacterium]|nr:glycosyltransferase family 1 protein [Candidatus Kapabacteria bacterium]